MDRLSAGGSFVNDSTISLMYSSWSDNSSPLSSETLISFLASSSINSPSSLSSSSSFSSSSKLLDNNDTRPASIPGFGLAIDVG